MSFATYSLTVPAALGAVSAWQTPAPTLVQSDTMQVRGGAAADAVEVYGAQATTDPLPLAPNTSAVLVAVLTGIVPQRLVDLSASPFACYATRRRAGAGAGLTVLVGGAE